jgi:hypothetical protein
MLKKSIALFLLRAYPSGAMGMLTLPHQIFYIQKVSYDKMGNEAYILGGFVKDNSLFFGSTARLATR